MLGGTRKRLIHCLNDCAFILVEQTRFDQVVQPWKAFLDSWRDIGQDHGETEADITHDCTTHNTTSLILAMHIGADKDCYGIWPGNGGVLIPPARHHNRYIETQDEGERYEISITVAIRHNGLEGSARRKNIN